MASEAEADVDEDSRAEVDQFYDHEDPRQDEGAAVDEGTLKGQPSISHNSQAPWFSFR